MSAAVVRLPTAVTRQPPRATTRARREAKKLLPQFTGKLVEPWKRQALLDAADIQEAAGNSAALLALAAIAGMDNEGKDRVEAFLERTTVHEAGRLALSQMRLLTKPSTYGQQANIQWAFKRLDEKAGQ